MFKRFLTFSTSMAYLFWYFESRILTTLLVMSLLQAEYNIYFWHFVHPDDVVYPLLRTPHQYLKPVASIYVEAANDDLEAFCELNCVEPSMILSKIERFCLE